MSARPQLHGTRLALLGAILYFLEWVGISLAPSLPTDLLGHDPAKIVAAYADSPGWTAFLAGWLSVVLLGRILFVAAIRHSLQDVPRARILTVWAVSAMTASVVFEVIDYGLVATAGWLADAHADASGIVALDAAGAIIFTIIYGPLGVSVAIAALAMILSRLFPRWIGWLGLVSGTLLTLGGIVAASALGSKGGYHDLGQALTGFPALGMWIWMVATGVVLFRRAKRRPFFGGALGSPSPNREESCGKRSSWQSR
jgi:hypothetical protein